MDAVGLSHESGDDGEQSCVGLELGVGDEGLVDAHGSDELLGVLDGDAEEADGRGFVVGIRGGAGTGAVEEVGVFGDVGDDGGLPGVEDGAGDAFATGVAAALLFLGGESDGGDGFEAVILLVMEDE